MRTGTSKELTGGVPRNDELYLFNGHGDVVGVTDKSGNLEKSYEYDAFGNEVNSNSNDNNPFRYCGEYWDSETGSIYLRARYYSPGTGRFTTEDPIKDGSNWYSYCGGNPVIFEDMMGLSINYSGEISEGASKYISVSDNGIEYKDGYKKHNSAVILNVAPQDQYSVPVKEGEENNYCGPTVASMLVALLEGDSVNRILEFSYKFQEANKTKTNNEPQCWPQFKSTGYNNFDNLIAVQVDNQFSANELREQIDNGLLVPILYSNYKSVPEGEDHGHWVAVVGYINIGINGKTESLFIINDPSGGVTKCVTYAELCGSYNNENCKDMVYTDTVSLVKQGV